MQEHPTLNDLLNNFHQALQALAKKLVKSCHEFGKSYLTLWELKLGLKLPEKN